MGNELFSVGRNASVFHMTPWISLYINKLKYNTFVFKVTISLQKHSGSTYSSLSLVRLFIAEDPTSVEQSPYYTPPATTWIVGKDENTKNFVFDEVRCNIY